MGLFKVGDTVFYGTTGVCRIEELTEQIIAKEKKQYFVLRPVSQGGSTVLIPTENQLLLNKMRTPVTSKEITTALDDLNADSILWSDNTVERNQLFSETVKSRNCSARLNMLLGIYRHKNELSSKGKKLHITDEKALREAQRLIFDEFSYVMGQSVVEIEKLVMTKIKEINDK